MITLSLYSAPTNPVLEIAEVLDYLRINSSEEPLISLLIPAAGEYVEMVTGRSLITQTWQLEFHDSLPSGDILLPKCPLQSVSYFKYYDTTNVEQSIAGTAYEAVKMHAEPPRLRPVTSWPSTYRRASAATLRILCGYGLTSASIPPMLKIAMMLYVADCYENRNVRSLGLDGKLELPASIPSIDRILLPYRVQGTCLLAS